MYVTFYLGICSAFAFVYVYVYIYIYVYVYACIFERSCRAHIQCVTYHDISFPKYCIHIPYQ